MDENNLPENILPIKTHDLIITKIHELEKRIGLKLEKEDLKIESLKDAIKRQDEANAIRFKSVNNFRESLNDQLDRCATKDEMRLEISKEVSILEKALNKEANLLKDSIIINVNALEKSILSYKQQQQAQWVLLIAIVLVVVGEWIRRA